MDQNAAASKAELVDAFVQQAMAKKKSEEKEILKEWRNSAALLIRGEEAQCENVVGRDGRKGALAAEGMRTERCNSDKSSSQQRQW